MTDQLDIIDDTDLGRKNTPRSSSGSQTQNTPCSSSKAASKNTPCSSTGAAAENTPRLSTSGIKRLDARRKELGISITKLCAVAGVYPDTYRSVRLGLAQTRPNTMAKLTGALNRLATGEKANAPRSLTETMTRMLIAHMAREAGLDPAVVLATDFETQKPSDAAWLQAATFRRAAVYLMVEGLGVGKADMGHVLGISRQAVHQSVAAIESERDRDDEFDRKMRSMMIMVAGHK